METVHVSASREYDILIGSGLLASAGAEIRSRVKAKTLAVIAGSNVWPLWGETLAGSLKAAGFEVIAHVIPAGEQYKTLDTFAEVLNFFADNHLTRSDCAVALGGGVTGDLTGFAASAYMRGIEFIQIPTTLLSMVDSSVGGKTAVDLPAGKNLAGAFYQPSLVLCDTQVLSTLPEDVYRAGCAEVIKYAVLESPEFFEELKNTPVREQLEHVISVCVRMKRDIVNEDEFDRGRRAFLNLGHSFGHAIERCCCFELSHGYAVALGMNIITKAAAAMGICSADTQRALEELLRQYGLPAETSLSAAEIADAAMSDKKISGGKLSLIVPEAIGRCRIEKVGPEQAVDWLHAAGIQ